MVNGVSTLPVPNRPATLAFRTRSGCETAGAARSGFVAGDENRLLAAVVGAWCQALEDDDVSVGSPAWTRLASPLVFVGPTSSGKSHLAAAIAELAGDKRACFTTANDLRRDFAAAIGVGDAAQWRERLASTPLLVIDDVDHLPVRGSFQQELLHVATELAARGHKFIVTSARPIAHLQGWLPDLVSWFASGLALEIAQLGDAARREILAQVAVDSDWQFSTAAFDVLAEQASPEPRELFRLTADIERQFGRGARFEVDTLTHFLSKLKSTHAPHLSEINRVVARYYQLPLKMLTGSSRQAAIVSARATAIYLARTLTSSSYEQIGLLLGGRDHTTIMHSFRRTQQRLPRDTALRSAIEELSRLLRK